MASRMPCSMPMAMKLVETSTGRTGRRGADRSWSVGEAEDDPHGGYLSVGRFVGVRDPVLDLEGLQRTTSTNSSIRATPRRRARSRRTASSTGYMSWRVNRAGRWATPEQLEPARIVVRIPEPPNGDRELSDHGHGEAAGSCDGGDGHGGVLRGVGTGHGVSVSSASRRATRSRHSARAGRAGSVLVGRLGVALHESSRRCGCWRPGRLPPGRRRASARGKRHVIGAGQLRHGDSPTNVRRTTSRPVLSASARKSAPTRVREVVLAADIHH